MGYQWSSPCLLPTPAHQEESLGREQAFPMLISELPVSRMVHTLPKQYIASVLQSRCSADVSGGQQQNGPICKQLRYFYGTDTDLILLDGHIYSIALSVDSTTELF